MTATTDPDHRPVRRLRRAAVLAAVAGAVVLGACSDDGDDEATEDTTAEEEGTDTTAAEGGEGEETGGEGGGETVDAITIAGFAFDPEAPVVEAGAEISVTNEDSAPHNLTLSDEDLGTDDLDQGAEGTFTAPDAPGDYEFVCTIHIQMTGTMTVQ